MIKICNTFLLLIIFFNCLRPLLAEEGWKIEKEYDDILVYSRERRDSAFNEFKGTTVIKKNIWVILALLDDIPAQTEWINRCTEARVIKRVNDLERIYYCYIDVPWPFADRDVTAGSRVTINSNPDSVIIEAFNTTCPSLPPLEDAVRVPEFKTNFILKPVGNETQITFIFAMDPGGSMPAFLSNFYCVYIPLDTLIRLKELALKQKYIDASKMLRKRFEKMF